MDLPRENPGMRKFITNVGLITSDGPYGPNIMAAEWMHHISYAPALISVHLRKSRATFNNIEKTKEFGVNICATDQNLVSSVSGHASAKEVDKISLLKELGIEFYPASKIHTLMVKGAAMNAECKLVNRLDLEDHIMLIGEVIDISYTDKAPLLYHDGKYWKVGEPIQKPGPEALERIHQLYEKYRKS